MNDYVQVLAEAFLGDNPDPQFIADIADGNWLDAEVVEYVGKAVGAHVSLYKVYQAWDHAGRPDYGQYLPFDYNDWGPDYRREQIANARTSAIADRVADALATLVIALVEDGGWEAVPCEKCEGQEGWFTDAGHLFGLETQSGYLVPPLSE
jgi:hypothetical protein|nr:MAG TPA: hypothetical protein [Caudoviricetes sp.]